VGWRDPELVPLFIDTVRTEMNDSLDSMRVALTGTG
jgi:hypothetical protein